MIGITELFRRYHHLIRELASRGAPEEAWRSDLRRLLASLNDECRELPRSSKELLHQELSNQIEHELLCATNPDARAVLTVVLKHLDPV
jgi:hypothetical protein